MEEGRNQMPAQSHEQEAWFSRDRLWRAAFLRDQRFDNRRG